MPKRKRDNDSDLHGEVEAKIIHGKKQLNKALKLAQKFERQKIDKRLKVAEKEAESLKKDRLLKESQALKTLDIAKVVDAHLHKTLLKTKSIVESGLLPTFVVLEKREGDQDELLAYDNVTARMYNMKPVKEAMTQIMASVYAVAGVPNSAQQKKKTKVEAKHEAPKGILKKREIMDSEAQDTDTGEKEDKEVSTVEQEALLAKLQAHKAKKEGQEAAWEGFDSGSEADSESDGDEFVGYNARIVGSSDEEGDEDTDDLADIRSAVPTTVQGRKTLNPRDLSITPSPPRSREPSPSPTLSLSDSDSEGGAEIEIPSAARVVKERKTKPPPTTQPRTGSQFLPTLMGGYWSGTDSDPEAIDDTPAIKPPRKNRRGQIERRKIAELKFGSSAKHIMAGKVPAKDMGRATRENGGGKGRKDGGWDAKRGASGPDDRRRGTRGNFRDRQQVTGDNAMPLGKRPEKKHRDDVGALHASWAAAKKAKDEQKTAKFEGKKVVFD